VRHEERPGEGDREQRRPTATTRGSAREHQEMPRID
jgi:hypothetical protein